MAKYSFADNEEPLVNIASEYLNQLLGGNRKTASQLILKAVERGEAVQDIYLYVFQRCQREIGYLWQTNQVSVAQEHYCTAATQLIMSQLYPYIFSTEKIGRTLVATCVSGELHEVGVRMVADFFELAGWDTYYVGANAPAESVVSALLETNADMLGISTTIHFHLDEARHLINTVRTSGVPEHVKIMVGGYLFNIAPELYKKVGADTYAKDAQQAVSVAHHLLVDSSWSAGS